MRYFALILVFLVGMALGKFSWGPSALDTIESAQAKAIIPEALSREPFAQVAKKTTDQVFKSDWQKLLSESASTAQSLLHKIPDFVLRRAYEERLQNRQIQAKDEFTALGLGNDLNRFFEFFKANESHWDRRKKRAAGTSTLLLDGKEHRAEFFVEMYRQSEAPKFFPSSTKEFSKTEIQDPHEICFLVELSIEKVPQPMGNGQCGALIWEASDQRYYAIIPVNADAVEPEYTQFAIELPMRGPGLSEFKAFETETGRWKKIETIDWKFLDSETWSSRRDQVMFSAIK